MNTMHGESNIDLVNHKTMHLEKSDITFECFLNEKKASITLCPSSKISVSNGPNYNYGLIEGGILETGAVAGMFRGIRNHGTMTLQGISGDSDFKNLGILTLRGKKEQPALINVNKFFNGYGKQGVKKDRFPKLFLQNVVFGPKHKEFTNDVVARIDSTELFSTSAKAFRNFGTWQHTGDLILSETNITNEKTGTIIWQEGKFVTQLEGFLPQLDVLERRACYLGNTTKSEATMLSRSISPRALATFRNDGKWIVHDMLGHGEITLANQNIINITGKSILWLHAIDNAPGAQIVLARPSSLKFHEQNNLGLLSHDELDIAHGKHFYNCGAMRLCTMRGKGSFMNFGQLSFEGTPQDPAQLAIANLTNGYKTDPENSHKKDMDKAYRTARLDPPTPHVEMSHVNVVMYTSITNLRNGQIDSRGNFTQKKLSWLSNHGNWQHVGKMDFGDQSRLRNSASGQMEIKGDFFAGEGLVENKGALSVREGKVEISGTDLKTDGSLFFRYGELDFRPKTSPFHNKGTWVLGMSSKQKLSVINDGTIKFDGGHLSFARLENKKELDFAYGSQSIDNLSNKGTMIFRHRDWTISTSPSPPSSSRYYDNRSGHVQLGRFHDEGTIRVTRGYTLNFDHPKLPNNLEVQKGIKFTEWPSKNLDGLVKIGTVHLTARYGLRLGADLMHDNVVYVDKDYRSSFIKYRVKAFVEHKDAKNGMFEGSIFIANGDSDFFESFGVSDEDLKTYGPEIIRTLSEKGHLRAPVPNVALTIPGNFIPVKNYDFNNINSLELTINGNFTLNHTLQAGSIKLNIDGDFTLGKNNDVMATLAALLGPLTIEALTIDARYGQIYGKGPTKLTATASNGWITCGAAKKCPNNPAKDLGVASSYTTVVGDRYVYTTINDVNGAFISSGSTLDIDAGEELDLDYGQVFSRGDAHFTARNTIDAVRSIIRGNGNATWKAPKIYFGRAPVEQLYLGWMSSGYPDEKGLAAKSDGTEYTNTGSITFNTPQFILQASTISSYGSVNVRDGRGYVNIKDRNDPELKKLAKVPSSLILRDYYRTGGPHLHNRRYFYPKIISPDEINFHFDNLTITGMINGAKIVCKATVDAVFKNNSQGRVKVVLEPVLVDITAYARKVAGHNGFFTLTGNNSVETKFPMGEPFRILPHQTITLHERQNPPFSAPLRYLDPMKSMSADMWNIFLQEIAGNDLGTVRFKGNANDTMLNFCLHNNENLRRESQKESFTKEELERYSGVFLVRRFIEKDQKTELHTFLCASADQKNEYQSNGDISGDQFESESGRHQHHENNRVHMDKSAKFKVGGDFTRETTKYTVVHSENGTTTSEDHAMPEQTVDTPEVSIKVDGNYTTTGTTTIVKNTLHEEIKGKIAKKPLTLNKTTTHTSSSNNVFSSHNSVSVVCENRHRPSRELVGSGYSQSDENIHLEAVQIKCRIYTFKAPVVRLDAAVAENSRYENSESSNGFSTSETTSRERSPTITPTVIVAEEKVTFDAPRVEVNGSDLLTPTIDASAATQGFYVGPAMARGEYFHENVQSSPTSYAESGAKGWYDVMRASQIISEKLILSSDANAENVFDTVFLAEDIKIIGSYVEKVTVPREHHETWSRVHQVLPEPVIHVLAMAVAYYTGGFAATIGKAMAGAGTTAAVAIKAGVQAFCAHYAAGLARHGDTVRATKEVFSPDSLTAIGAAMVSAGALDKVASTLDVNMAPGQTEVVANVCKYGLANGVNAATKVAFNMDTPESALRSAFCKTLLQTVGAYLAHQIGVNFEAPAAKLAVHAGLGAGLAHISGGNALEGAGAAALSEFLAMTTIDAIGLQNDAFEEADDTTDLTRVYAEKLDERFQWIRLMTSLAVGLLGGDPARADAIAGNVLEHNFGSTQGAFYRNDSEDSEEIISIDELLKTQQEDRATFVQMVKEILEEEAMIGAHSNLSTEDKIDALWQMFKRDWKEGAKHYATMDHIKILASLPIPGSGVAAFAHEAQEIVRGNQSITGAAFELAVGIVQGKIVIGIVKHSVKGASYVWKSAKELGSKVENRWRNHRERLLERRIEREAEALHRPVKPYEVHRIKIGDLPSPISGLEIFEGKLEMLTSSQGRIFLGYFEGTYVNLRALLTGLKTFARQKGVKELEIRGIIINKPLKNTLKKYFALKPSNWMPWDYIRYWNKDLPARFYDRMKIKLD